MSQKIPLSTGSLWGKMSQVERGLGSVLGDIRAGNPLQDGDFAILQRTYGNSPYFSEILDAIDRNGLNASSQIQQIFNKQPSQREPTALEKLHQRLESPPKQAFRSEPERPVVPKMPPHVVGPTTGYKYYYNLPENPQNGHIFAQDVNMEKAQWLPIGEKASSYGMTLRTDGANPTINESLHGNNVNIPADPNKFSEKLRQMGLSTDGTPEERAQRFIGAQEYNPLLLKARENEHAGLQNIIPISDAEIAEAGQQALRPEGYNKAIEEANIARERRRTQGIQQPLAQLERSQPLRGGIDLPAVSESLPTAEAAGAAEGALGTAASFAGRAMPLIGLALMGANLVKGSSDRVEAEEEAEQKRRMKT